MEFKTIVDTIGRKHPGAILKQTDIYGTHEITVALDSIFEVMKTLREEKTLGFDMLTDIVGIDRMPRSPRFDLVYVLLSTKDFTRLIVRTETDEAKEVPSMTGIWHSADWAEREVFDLMGVRFSNHPDLRRILTWENFDGHPLRKDFPLEGKDFDKPFDTTTIQDYC
jgi:NADH-quinone oxidoreductase subunit C